MNPENLGYKPHFTANNLLRRKRGRPRKDRSQIQPIISNAQPLSNLTHNCGEGAPVPPGFERANGNQPHQADATDDPDDAMVGQVVTGVIEAAFDAGYLLSVRVGDSVTRLRGVVFKPGHYVPVTAQNDVVPHVQMIRRTEVPFPAANHSQIHGSNRRGRERSEYRAMHPSNESPPANQLVKFKGKSKESPPANQLVKFTGTQMSPVTAQLPPPVGARGTVVPVILQPVNLPNGAAPAIEAPPLTFKPAHLAVSKPKHVPALPDHRLPSQTPSSQEETPKSSQKQTGSTSQSAKEADARLPVKPFDQWVNEGSKRIDESSGSEETQNENGKSAGGSSSDASALTPEQIQDLSRPLLIKPLQAIRSEVPDQPTPLSQTRTGKMTELLMAVQENLIDKQKADARNQDFTKQRT
ncbi:hypothetical protein Ancab_004469 [Ancistrocladus abbreviatus]